MQRKYLGPILLGGTLMFTQDLAQQIMGNLQEQKYREVAPLINKMNDEATHQPAPQAHVETPAAPVMPAPAPVPPAPPAPPVPATPAPPTGG